MSSKDSKKRVELPDNPTARERTVAILEELHAQDEFEDLTVMDATRISNVPTQSSGVLTLDVLLGGGPPPGIPQGRIIEVFGSEGSGKTTLTLHMVAEAQRRGSACAFIDVEHALDPTYAQRIGVDFSTLLFRQPDSGEKALDTVEALVERYQRGDLVVVDSVAGLVPQAELDGEMGDSHMGLQARLMSQAMRKLNGSASTHGVSVIFINQIRMKIGVVFGNPETTTGGNALKFYASQRIEVKTHGEKPKDKEGNIIGQRVQLHVVKNKIAPPFRKGEVILYYGQGFPRYLELFHMAVGLQIITKTGASYSYGDERLGVGMEKVLEVFMAREDLQRKVESEVLQRYGYKS